MQLTNWLGPILLGEDIHEQLALVVDRSTMSAQQETAEDVSGWTDASQSKPGAGCLLGSNHDSSVGSPWNLRSVVDESRVVLRRIWRGV